MSKEEQAWSDEADAVYVATVASIDGLATYSERMNLMLNLTRYIMMTEVAVGVQEAVGNQGPSSIFVETGILTTGMQCLVDEYAKELTAMPRRLQAIIHAENGCGGCGACKAAQKEAYGDGKVQLLPSKEARGAVEGLINTMLGGKPSN